MINTGFTFNGIHSDAMGVSLVRLDSNLITVPYVAGKDILETHPNKSLYPYFFGVKHQPLQFTITIASEDNDMDATKLYNLAQWLFKEEYKEFISDDNTDKVYYVIATNQADFMTNGFDGGYIEIQLRCRDGFGWTVSEEEVFDLTAIASTPIVMNNGSNISEYFYPEIEIELTGSNTAFELINTTDNNNSFAFTGLEELETIYVDNQKRIILTSVGDSVNRFNKFNLNWFRLRQGNNTITVNGECIITYKKHFPVFT